MSVLGHLTSTADNIKILDTERSRINTSINHILANMNSYFSNVDDKFVFGSYDRKTILKRSVDYNSDIDLMVVFNDGNYYTPQTLMNRLKRFAEYYYSKSQIYQSSPTVVLELNHIKFELAPAFRDNFNCLYIPAPASDYCDWINTQPNVIKDLLDEKNRESNYIIRKLVRLLKYWNVENGKVYSSYELECHVITTNYFFCSNLKEYFYSTVGSLPTHNLPYYKQIKADRFKQIVENVKYYENNGMPYNAEDELKKAIPQI